MEATVRVRRGDIGLVDLRGSEGREKSGVRPCVVVQKDIWNRASPVTIVAPLTHGSSRPRIPRLVVVSAVELGAQEAKDSVVDCGQLRVIDGAVRISRKLGTLAPVVMARIDRGLAASFGLPLDRPPAKP
jgi:mRNA-degrading endonuclease toxin of MazEF toxin-antitoxin module